MPEDLGAEIEDARRALLEAIARTAREGSSNVVLRLAEAYAWVTAPDQPHGGSAGVEK
jgi:hypothetical protein